MREEAEGRPPRSSGEKGEWLCADVRSENEPGKWYEALQKARRQELGRLLRMPDFRYRGGPCKHVARLKRAVVAAFRTSVYI